MMFTIFIVNLAVFTGKFTTDHSLTCMNTKYEPRASVHGLTTRLTATSPLSAIGKCKFVAQIYVINLPHTYQMYI
jgi:hypothetical protein